MKTFSLTFVALLLSACSTPQPIVDTAALVSRMSSDMDRSVTSYVDSLALIRQSDARRVEATRMDGQKHRRSLADDIRILQLADDPLIVKTLTALTVEPAADTLKSAKVASGKSAASPQASFDATPLRNVSQATAGIAQPRSSGEQLRTILRFATDVNHDLIEAAAENKQQAGR